MRTLLTVCALAAATAGATACSSYGEDYSYGPRSSYEACRRAESDRKVAGTVAGAAIGALAGSAIAGNSSNTEGAIAGGVVGGVVGNQAANSRRC